MAAFVLTIGMIWKKTGLAKAIYDIEETSAWELMEGCRLDTEMGFQYAMLLTMKNVPIFLDLMYDHLCLLTYRDSAVRVEKRIMALRPVFFRSSCSGSAAQLRKVTTSLAICEVVAGVPISKHVSRTTISAGSHEAYHRRTQRVRRREHAPSKWHCPGSTGCSSCHHGSRNQPEGRCNQ